MMKSMKSGLVKSLNSHDPEGKGVTNFCYTLLFVEDKVRQSFELCFALVSQDVALEVQALSAQGHKLASYFLPRYKMV